MKFLGEYLRENVLTLPKKTLRLVELPRHDGQLKIEKDLFGWKLYYNRPGRKTQYFLECKTEEEARYLLVFMGSLLTEIYIPKDIEYLKKILPELEKLKKRIAEVLEFNLRGVLNRKIREQVTREVYMEVTK